MDREQLVEAMALAMANVRRAACKLPPLEYLTTVKLDEREALVSDARAALAVAEPVVREWERESTPGTVRIEQTIQGDTVSTRFDTSNLSLDDALAAVAKARDSLTTELDLAVSCPMHTALRSRTGVAP